MKLSGSGLVKGLSYHSFTQCLICFFIFSILIQSGMWLYFCKNFIHFRLSIFFFKEKLGHVCQPSVSFFFLYIIMEIFYSQSIKQNIFMPTMFISHDNLICNIKQNPIILLLMDIGHSYSHNGVVQGWGAW